MILNDLNYTNDLYFGNFTGNLNLSQRGLFIQVPRECVRVHCEIKSASFCFKCPEKFYYDAYNKSDTVW